MLFLFNILIDILPIQKEIPLKTNHVELEQTIIIKNKMKIISNKTNKYSDLVIEISNKFNLDPLLIWSIIRTESNFNPKAKSSVGASGLMQVMPKTKNYIAKLLTQEEHIKIHKLAYKYNIDYSIVENIYFGTFYFKYLFKKFNNKKHAIVAYNMGPNWVKRKISKNYPVGSKNQYLNKIVLYYRQMSNPIISMI